MKYNVKRACIFHLILFGILSTLWYCRLRTSKWGVGGLLNGQNPLRVTKVMTVPNFNIKIGIWFAVVVVVRVDSALMNLFLRKWHWLYLQPFNYCMNVRKVRHLSTVFLTQLHEIITFYSLYNYQSIFNHWHIKPIGPCYSSIVDIWHHDMGERQFCIIPGDETLFCFKFPKVI